MLFPTIDEKENCLPEVDVKLNKLDPTTNDGSPKYAFVSLPSIPQRFDIILKKILVNI